MNETNTNGGFDFGALADSVASIIGGFNYKAQNNQLAIAQANADAANAQANAANAQPKSNTTIWLVVIGAIVLIALFLMFKQS